MRWLGDGCFTAIIEQRQMERREKKTVWWKENDTETQFDDEREWEEEKKWEKKRSEKEQHQDIKTLYPLLRKWYTSNLRASSKKREEERERKNIYIHYLSQHLTVHYIKKQRKKTHIEKYRHTYDKWS
jgi:hypothetical protein